MIEKSVNHLYPITVPSSQPAGANVVDQS